MRTNKFQMCRYRPCERRRHCGRWEKQPDSIVWQQDDAQSCYIDNAKEYKQTMFTNIRESSADKGQEMKKNLNEKTRQPASSISLYSRGFLSFHPYTCSAPFASHLLVSAPFSPLACSVCDFSSENSEEIKLLLTLYPF